MRKITKNFREHTDAHDPSSIRTKHLWITNPEFLHNTNLLAENVENFSIYLMTQLQELQYLVLNRLKNMEDSKRCRSNCPWSDVNYVLLQHLRS
jgi:hypothetical protein